MVGVMVQCSACGLEESHRHSVERRDRFGAHVVLEALGETRWRGSGQVEEMQRAHLTSGHHFESLGGAHDKEPAEAFVGLQNIGDT